MLKEFLKIKHFLSIIFTYIDQIGLENFVLDKIILKVILRISLVLIFLILLYSCTKGDLSVPVVTTLNVSEVTYTTALSGGKINLAEVQSLIASGICWDTSSSPSIQSCKTSISGGFGVYTCNLTKLSPNTLYFVRAYAVNSAGIGYGDEISFTTDNIELPTLVTNAVTSVSLTTAKIGGSILKDNGGYVNERGVCWSMSQSPTIGDFKSASGTGTGTFIIQLSGLKPGTLYYVRAYAANSMGTSYGNEISFTTDPLTVSDIEGNIYNVVRIGTQLWMAENLRTTKYNDGSPIPNIESSSEFVKQEVGVYCWGSTSIDFINTYGAHYNFFAVADNRSLCPSGWHIPTDSEWTELENYLGGSNIAGGKLKEVGSLHWDVENVEATNESGFNALPGSMVSFYPSINMHYWTESIGHLGYWWSSTQDISSGERIKPGWIRRLESGRSGIIRDSNSARNGCSVRCIKNQ
jgi:uncharacterized protein (TIGR02145 family)